MATAIEDRIPVSLALPVTREAGAVAEALLECFPRIRRTMVARMVYIPVTCDGRCGTRRDGKRQAPTVTDDCIYFY